MNNFLNNPQALQKALMAGILGYLNNAFSTPGSSYGASQVQNPNHRCNLNLDEHLKYADALVSAGIIDKKTGESIKQNMTATFQAESTAAPANRLYTQSNGVITAGDAGNNQAMQAFETANFGDSDFLKARECLLDYLKNLDVELSYEDLAKIESVVLELEKLAVQRNQNENKQNAFDMLNKSNEIAKERLMTGSMGAKGSKNPPQKTFTRDEIAKMSTAEFIKNEPAINYQLQNGLL